MRTEHAQLEPATLSTSHQQFEIDLTVGLEFEALR